MKPKQQIKQHPSPGSPTYPLMLQKSSEKTTWEIYKEKSVNNRMNYPPQLVSLAGFLVAINSTKMHINSISTD